MIPTTREILTAVYGAWTLLKLDPRGLELFEDSLPAAVRSFFAAVIVAPGFAILRLMEHVGSETAAGPLAILVVEAIAYVVVWAAFPLALYYLAMAFGRPERFRLAVVALNWSVVIQIALSLPVHLIAASGILSPGLATLAILAVLVVTLVYEGFVARTALKISSPMAALVVAIDVVISLAVQALVSGMLA
ncbi:MAG: hypothetical protein R3322_17585 [Kiloniellales bacterium]|jgi:hypothetical protein|nr:hypothetical protein [Kiloniellales bacterium]